ncbi:alpha/beta hydrolase [Mycolicibacterium cosmeticum]|uniref:alpha/beta fold hydrolase n=1 Tax=Mycolicibacterium cosmeticum TaxID=258533 RepID=UPI00320488A8
MSNPDNGYLASWTTDKAQWFTRADGSRLRYLVTGDGPPLILLHTVRTQLDYFQRLIPLVAGSYRVYALDLPGMGWSDIVPGATYEHGDLLAAVVEFVNGLELTDATLAGESMGAVLALTASAELGKRVVRVVSSNTYDYPQGLERANLLARIIIPSVRAPIVGPTFAALENRAIVKGIVSGGFADPTRLPDAFIDELVRVGNRQGYSRVARAIYRNLPTLIAARDRYRSITVPVTLIYTTKDWSRNEDRVKTAAAIPSATVITIDDAGHFCAMERPRQFADVILQH